MVLPPKSASFKRRQPPSPKAKQNRLKKKKRPKKAKKNAKKNVVAGLSPPNPLMTPVTVKNQGLVKLLGSNCMIRPHIYKRIFDYAKEHELKDPNDKRIVVCDDTLRRILRVKSFTLPELAVVLKPLVMTQKDQLLLQQASTTAYRTGTRQPPQPAVTPSTRAPSASPYDTGSEKPVDSSTSAFPSSAAQPQSRRPAAMTAHSSSTEASGNSVRPPLCDPSDRKIKPQDTKTDCSMDTKPPYDSRSHYNPAVKFDGSQFHNRHSSSTRPYTQQLRRPSPPAVSRPSEQQLPAASRQYGPHRPQHGQHDRPEWRDRPPHERRDRPIYERRDRPVYERSSGVERDRRDRPAHERGDRPVHARGDRAAHERRDVPEHNRPSSSSSQYNHPAEYPHESQLPALSHTKITHSSSEASRKRNRRTPIDNEGVPVGTNPQRDHHVPASRRPPSSAAPRPLNHRESSHVSGDAAESSIGQRWPPSSVVLPGGAGLDKHGNNSTTTGTAASVGGGGYKRRRSSASSVGNAVIDIDGGDSHQGDSSGVVAAPADAIVKTSDESSVDGDGKPLSKVNTDELMRDILDGLTVDVHDMSPKSCTLDIALMMTPRVHAEWEAKRIRFELHWEAESNDCRTDGWQRGLDFRTEAHPDYSAVPRIASTVGVAQMIPSQPYCCTLKLRHYSLRLDRWESRKTLCKRRIPQRARPEEWSTAETSTFASSLRIPRLSTVFLEYGINGEALMRLNSADFKALGVTAPFLLDRVISAVGSLKGEGESAATPPAR